jgi:uncharacterized protein YkwD
VGLLGISLLALTLFSVRCSREAPSPAAAPASEYESWVHWAVNEERRRAGLQSLAWDDRLAEQARAHSRRMVERGFFEHRDPELGDLGARLKRARIRCFTCAENIFQQQGHLNPPAVAVENWMKSPGHRANILTPAFTRTGVGVAVRRDGTHFFTQIFTGERR